MYLHVTNVKVYRYIIGISPTRGGELDVFQAGRIGRNHNMIDCTISVDSRIMHSSHTDKIEELFGIYANREYTVIESVWSSYEVS